jgi:mycofactocin radical SAM maturase
MSAVETRDPVTPAPRLVDLFETGLESPICLTWELTYACNLSCVHCLSSSGRRDPRELTTAECFAVVDELQAMQVFYVNIGGGEPTVRSDFWQVVDYATSCQVGVKFSTNGIKIDRTVADRLAGSDYVDVQVSLDGATADVNDAVRGVGSYATALTAMEHLAAAGMSGFKISVVATRHNLGQLDAFKALADRYAATLRITRLRPSGRGADSWDDLHPLPGQQRDLYDWLLAHGEGVLTGDSFFHLAAYGDGSPDGSLPGLNLCGAGRVVCLIDPVGDVYACPFAIHDAFKAGNVRDPGGFADVWRSSQLFADLRRPQKGGACSGCSAFGTCRGGCMAAKFFTGLPLDGPDPECVKGHADAAVAAVAATRGTSGTSGTSPLPRPGQDHSHRTAPASPPTVAARTRPAARTGPGVRPVPVTIGRSAPTSSRAVSACEDDPLAGFTAAGTVTA